MDIQKNRITEISMERTVRSGGNYPVYTVTFKEGGDALYEGKDNVKKIGPYIGEMDIREFEKLAELVERLNLKELQESYSTEVKDQTRVIITINYTGNVKKIDNYAGSAPVEVWAVERVIDALIEDIYWEKA